MKLIEFIEGSLQGITLPIESKLILTSEEDNLGQNMLSLPGELSAGIVLEFQSQEKNIYLTVSNKKPIKLIENNIYSISGVKFFIFSEGNRKPKIKKNFLKKYSWMVIMFVLLNLAVTILSLMMIKSYQNNNTENYLNAIGNGYIKNGEIYIFDESIKNSLPADWLDNIKVINPDNYIILSHLNVDIKSKNNNEIPFEFVDKGEYSEILIDYPEKMINIMKSFGENGITFKYTDNLLLVDNVLRASQLLKSLGYYDEVSRLKLINDDAEIIDAQHFPYAIFFSSQGLSYVYDQQSRYWEGGIIPEIGRIDLIAKDKIIFTQANKKRFISFQNNRSNFNNDNIQLIK
ncbi:hypothetical protein [Providencia sneebia]|uniref:Uncharacterized protein n=1 Tax=Providencia sneebia DSM 19967 TaxID=1141660 RepID=K8WRM4_9GAMM|nr:hypothetical protein OO7_04649 [Providencia sneebia DSM 19967]